ncbi:hypothetical protein HID58_047493, partial [Brassica napus]
LSLSLSLSLSREPSSRSTVDVQTRLRQSKPQNVESSARITTFSDTHERRVCSSLYESHNPALTHLLSSTIIAESVPLAVIKGMLQRK